MPGSALFGLNLQQQANSVKGNNDYLSVGLQQEANDIKYEKRLQPLQALGKPNDCEWIYYLFPLFPSLKAASYRTQFSFYEEAWEESVFLAECPALVKRG